MALYPVQFNFSSLYKISMHATLALNPVKSFPHAIQPLGECCWRLFSQHSCKSLLKFIFVTCSFWRSNPLRQTIVIAESASRVADFRRHRSFQQLRLLLLQASTSSQSLKRPSFAEPIPNVTAAVGREAVLQCTIDDLGSFTAIHDCTSFQREFSTSKNQMLDILNCVTGARKLVRVGDKLKRFKYALKFPCPVRNWESDRIILSLLLQASQHVHSHRFPYVLEQKKRKLVLLCFEENRD
ncbi:hypothetical protein TNCV_4691361 [Trichonephila clavipes]|nr:hypothetical protein TNCV_4691361 [Trichonephila clavipes]